MQHNILRPRQALNKAYLRLKIARTEIERFKQALHKLLASIDLNESEAHSKNYLRDFLLESFYGQYGLNSKGNTDLVIHTGAGTKTPAGVLLEVKRPTNKGDMPTLENMNYKAMHELVLYYMRERVEHKNKDLKQLVITSVHEWFVFDALEFDRLFYRNGELKKDFTEWSQGKKSGNSTDFFYREIAAPFIAGLTEQITFTHFNLKEYKKPLKNKDPKDDVKLVALFKLLSPVHLLKKPFANDANSLDPGFYLELLHLIGLEEVKEKGRKLIRRKAKPDPGSLLEAAYQKLKSEDLVSGLDNPYSYGNIREEQLFNVALELCITWMNRILFLKLLEAQLASYHQGDRKYTFMNPEHLREFDDLNELFFDVLAERPQDRNASVRDKYRHIPYLNSSLFETTELEKRTLRISNLKDSSRLPLYPRTVLRDGADKALSKSQDEMRTLEYLLRFLGSYDFGAEGKEAIQEENKTLITASVLGLIFEKINGYRDGSFYTPGFITMYMSREAIRGAVVQQFAAKYHWFTPSNPFATNTQSMAPGLSTGGPTEGNEQVFGVNLNGITGKQTDDSGAQPAEPTFESLLLHISRAKSIAQLKEYNALIDSIRICDPAVGSGHYLVSALNELIVIKSELRLLLNRQGKPLNYGKIEVLNDELIITNHHGELFSYTVHEHSDGHRSINPQVQELQETLFHEKQILIENCLFGVDINPNSVKICRLRLWIELLKNAYYQQQGAVGYTELQTLPNIDINIKQGNSLLSRYPLTADLQEAFGKKGHSLQAYREAVSEYKHTNSKKTKKQLEDSLKEMKLSFKTTLANNDPLRKKMADLRGQISVMQNPDLFGAKKVDKKLLQQKQTQFQKLETEREQIETNKIYEGAFEWRFEFPEVLDVNGNYKGFDVVIGNPPYSVVEKERNTSLEPYKRLLSYMDLSNRYNEVTGGKLNLFRLFIYLAHEIATQGAMFSYIIPLSFAGDNNLLSTRKFVFDNFANLKLLCFPQKDSTSKRVFPDAKQSTAIILSKISKAVHSKSNIEVFTYPGNSFLDDAKHYSTTGYDLQKFDAKNLVIPLVDKSEWSLLNNLNSNGSKPISTFDEIIINRGEINQTIYRHYITTNKDNKNLLKGVEIGQYTIRTKLSQGVKEYFDEESFLSKNKPLTIIDKKRIAIQRITGVDERLRIVAAIAPDYSYFADSTNSVYVADTSKLSLNYLLGLFNSKLYQWRFKKTSTNNNVSTTELLSLPFRINKAIEKDIEVYVEQVLTAKQADAAADTSALEAEIDLLVYHLYELIYDEVLLVEPKVGFSREEYEQGKKVLLMR